MQSAQKTRINTVGSVCFRMLLLLILASAVSCGGSGKNSVGGCNTDRCNKESPLEPIYTLDGKAKNIYALAFGPGGKLLASGGGSDGAIRIWDVAKGQLVRRIDAGSDAVFDVAFSPDGVTLAAPADSSNDVCLYNIEDETITKLWKLTGHTASPGQLVFSPDGKSLASAGGDKVRLWDVSTREEIQTFVGHTHNVNYVAFHPNGKTLVSCGADRTIRVWDVKSGKELLSWIAHDGRIIGSVLSADGERVVSLGFHDRRLKIWDIHNGKMIRSIDVSEALPYTAIGPSGFESPVKVAPWGFALSPDEQTIVTWKAHKIELRDFSSGEVTYTFGNGAYTATFTPDGTVLATAGNGTIELWDFEDLRARSRQTGKPKARHD